MLKLDYIKKDFKNLNENEGFISLIYNACVKEGKKGRRLKRLNFFIYWLGSQISDSWRWKNFKKLWESKEKLEEKSWKKVEKILDELAKDPDLAKYFPNQDIAYQDIIKIKSRYRKKLIIEKKIMGVFIKSLGLPTKKDFDSLESSLLKCQNKIAKAIEPIKKYIELKDEILEFIKSEQICVQSSMRRKRFRRVNIDLFEKIINHLEKEGMISIRKATSGRKFLIYESDKFMTIYDQNGHKSCEIIRNHTKMKL